MKKLFLILLLLIMTFNIASCGADNTVDDDDQLGDSDIGDKDDDGTEGDGDEEAEHVHSFGVDLEFNVNEHYYACACGERRDAMPHELVTGDALEPTCYSFGYSSVEYCEECGFVKTTGAEIAKLPHTYEDGVCAVCEIPEPSIGLEYELSSDGEYYVIVGVGECKDDVIVIPEKYEGLPIKEIAAGAFDMCVSIREIIISDFITVIDEYAFSGCELLTNVTLGANVEEIGFGAFYDTAYYLNQKNWENGVLYLDNALIEVKSIGVIELDVKEGTTVIADHAFSKSEELVSVNISGDVKYIGKYAFLWCDALESVIIPEGTWYARTNSGDQTVDLADPASAAEVFSGAYSSYSFYRD